MDWMIPVFGWFHLLMAVENSIHTQYYGNRSSMSLLHDFELLRWKGLSTTSIKGTFHHQLHEALQHIACAHFRDAWLTIGNKRDLANFRDLSAETLLQMAEQIINELASTSALVELDNNSEEHDAILRQTVQFNRDILDYLELDEALRKGDVGRVEDLLPRLYFHFSGGRNGHYAIEVLELIQSLHREWPDDVKTFIREHCWLANTTGRPGAFLPIDLLQEHNVRDIKVRDSQIWG
jgi:hypothetical protein